MSFKREGNDKGLLDNLKRRRIKELFAEGIPEDEAKLLCNGRFACLVCSQNPIFDTVSMLMVHRQGKKHAAGEAGFLQKKRELQALILRRKHEQYMKDGTTDIKQATPAVLGGIRSSDPYDPCVKKHKVKPYERRQRVDLLNSGSSDMTRFSTSSSSIPSASGFPVKHSHQLKNIFRPTQRPQAPAQPYISHRHGNTGTDRAHYSVVFSSTPSQSSIPSTEQGGHLQEALSNSSTHVCQHSSNFVNPVSSDVSFTQTSSGCRELSTNNCGVKASGSVVSFGREKSGKRNFAAAENRDKKPVASVSSADTGERKMAEKYHLLGGSGWKKDWDGKWIRDENAEFDSDEDTPDLP